MSHTVAGRAPRYYLHAVVPAPIAVYETDKRAQIIRYPIDPGSRPRVLLSARPGGASEFGLIAFDPTGTSLLFEGGGYPLSRLANGKVTTLDRSAEPDTESSGAW